jgi:hypothetical protein
MPDVLTVAEITALLTQLHEPGKTAVFVAFSTGLLVSELAFVPPNVSHAAPR